MDFDRDRERRARRARIRQRYAGRDERRAAAPPPVVPPRAAPSVRRAPVDDVTGRPIDEDEGGLQAVGRALHRGVNAVDVALSELGGQTLRALGPEGGAVERAGDALLREADRERGIGEDIPISRAAIQRRERRERLRAAAERRRAENPPAQMPLNYPGMLAPPSGPDAEALAGALREAPGETLRGIGLGVAESLPETGAGLALSAVHPAAGVGFYSATGTGRQLEDAAHDDAGRRVRIGAREGAAAVASGVAGAAVETLADRVLIGRVSRSLRAAGVPRTERRAAVREITRSLGRAAREAERQGRVEAGTEIVQTGIENLGARFGWDPSRDVTEGMVDAAVVGYASGLGLGAGGQTAGAAGRRLANVPTTTPPADATEQPAAAPRPQEDAPPAPGAAPLVGPRVAPDEPGPAAADAVPTAVDRAAGGPVDPVDAPSDGRATGSGEPGDVQLDDAPAATVAPTLSDEDFAEASLRYETVTGSPLADTPATRAEVARRLGRAYVLPDAEADDTRAPADPPAGADVGTVDAGPGPGGAEPLLDAATAAPEVAGPEVGVPGELRDDGRREAPAGEVVPGLDGSPLLGGPPESGASLPDARDAAEPQLAGPTALPQRADGQSAPDYVAAHRDALVAAAEAEQRAVVEAGEFDSEGDAAEAVLDAAEQSENPAVLVEAWAETRRREEAALDPTQSPEAAIAEHLPFIGTDEAGEFGDLTGAQRRAYFRAPRQQRGTGAGSGRARATLAEAAEAVAQASGLDVGTADVVDFIRRYASQGAYRADVRRRRRGIEGRLREITGEPVSDARVEALRAALYPDAGAAPRAAGENPSGYGARNRVVTEDAYRAALAELGEVAPFSNPMGDPRKYAAAAKVAAYHVEALIREGVAQAQRFAEFARRMRGDVRGLSDDDVRRLYAEGWKAAPTMTGEPTGYDREGEPVHQPLDREVPVVRSGGAPGELTGEAVRAWAKENLYPATLRNEEAGLDGYVRGKSVGKILAGQGGGRDKPLGRARVAALYDIVDLFAQAVPTYSGPDPRGDNNVRALHRLYAPYEFEGDLLAVRFVVRDYEVQRPTQPDGAKVHSLRIDEIQVEPAVYIPFGHSESADNGPPAGSDFVNVATLTGVARPGEGGEISPGGQTPTAPPAGNDGAPFDASALDAALADLGPTPADATAPGAAAKLSKAEIAEVRRRLGLGDLAPAARRRWSGLLDRVLADLPTADAAIAEADGLLARFLGDNGKPAPNASPLTDYEHVVVTVAEARLLERRADLERQASRAESGGDVDLARSLQGRALGVLEQVDRVTTGADLAGSAAGRALAVRRIALRKGDADALEVTTALSAARRMKGEPLTTAERKEVADAVKRAQEAEARVKELEAALAKKDERAARRAISEAAKEAEAPPTPKERAEGAGRGDRQRARDERRAEIRTERADLKAQLAKKIGGQLNSGLDPEALALVGRLALNYAKEASLTLEQVVDRVRQDFPALTHEDVVVALATPKSGPNAPGAPQRTEAEYGRAKLERRRAVAAVRLAQRALKPKTTRDGILEALETPRALMATGDISATLRQGGVLVSRRPKTAARVMGEAVRAMRGDDNAEAIDIRLREGEHFELAEMVGMFFSPVGDEAKVAHAINREEDFAAKWLQNSRGAKAIGLSAVMGASERHYVTFLNLMRYEAFAQFVEAYPDASMDDLRAWADFVNKASGRGDLGSFSGAARALSLGLFSPRFTVSRWQALTALLKHARRPSVRNEIMRDLGSFVGVRLALLALSSVALGALADDEDDVSVGLDPTKSDFGKLVAGDVRLDVWAGVQQPVRAVLRVGMLPTATYAPGALEVAGIDPDDAAPGFGNGVVDIAANFFGYKLSPQVSASIALFEGQNAVGEEQGPGETVVRSVIPLSGQETFDAVRDGDVLTGAVVFGASSLGLGAAVYGDPLKRGAVASQLDRTGYRPGPPGGKAFERLTPEQQEVAREAFEADLAERLRAIPASARGGPVPALRRQQERAATAARRAALRAARDGKTG